MSSRKHSSPTVDGEKAVPIWVLVETREMTRELAEKFGMSMWGVVHLLLLEAKKNNELVDFVGRSHLFPSPGNRSAQRWKEIEARVESQLHKTKQRSPELLMRLLAKTRKEDDHNISEAQLNRALLNLQKAGKAQQIGSFYLST